MTIGDKLEKKIEDWILAYVMTTQMGSDPFFRASTQARIDDGSSITVIYHKTTKESIQGGLHTTSLQEHEMKEIGMLVD